MSSKNFKDHTSRSMVNVFALKRRTNEPVNTKWIYLCLLFFTLYGVPNTSASDAISCTPCSPPCDCNRVIDYCIVDCSQGNFRVFPEASFFPDQEIVGVLNFSDNFISTVDAAAFSSYSQLKVLDLSNNGILNIDEDAFRGLTNLLTLILKRNDVTRLPEDVFSPLSKLKTLDISGNPLQTLDVNAWGSSCPVENLSLNNLGLTVYPQEFITACQKLTRLYAADNYFKVFDNTSFTNLPLTVIDISHNLITTLPSQITFAENNLLRVNLSHNQLETLESNVLERQKNIELINLSNNPWRCDNNLYWLKLWLIDAISNGTTTVENIENMRCANSSGFLNISREFWFDSSSHLLKRYRRNGKPPGHFSSHTDHHKAIRWNELCRTFSLRRKVCKVSSNYGSCYSSSESDIPILVVYQEAFDFRNEHRCYEQCFDIGKEYFTVSSGVCLCGSEATTCVCPTNFTGIRTLCSNHYSYLQNVSSTDPQISFSLSNELTTEIPTNISVSSRIEHANHYEWEFGDGSGTYSTKISTITYLYTRPGIYTLTVACCSLHHCKRLSFPVKVKTLFTSPTLTASPFVETTKYYNISLSFYYGYDMEVKWKIGDNSSHISSGHFCRNLHTAYKGRCLKSYTPPVTFENAEKQCGTSGGSLLKIYNSDEIDEIKTALSVTNKLFVGAKQTGSHYRWISDNSLAFFTVSDVAAVSAGQCVVLTSSGLEGADCTTDYEYICQNGPVECPSGQLNRDNDHCYILHGRAETQEDAEKICQHDYTNGQLVTLSDETVQNFVITSVLNRFSTPEVWIGLKDYSGMGYFIWSNHDILQTFHPWGEKSESKCVTLNETGLWTSRSCSTKLRYICEYPRHDVVSVPSYLSGVSRLHDPDLSWQKLDETATFSTSQTTLQLFPGFWMSASGKLKSWNIKVRATRKNTAMALQIYRPTCPVGKHLVFPGCDGTPTKYATCVDSPPSCGTKRDCPEMLNLCLISKTCLNMTEICNCNSFPSSSFCSQNFSGEMPHYSLVTQNVILLPESTSARLYSVDSNFASVSEGDVIGIQTEGNHELIWCEDSNTVDWRHATVSIGSSGFLTLYSPAVDLTSSVWEENKVCYVNVIYSRGKELNLPDSLAYFYKPGIHTMESNTSSGSQTTLTTHSFFVQEKIEGLSIIYPTVYSIKSSLCAGLVCVGTVFISPNTELLFVVKVSRGSSLNSYWSYTSSNESFKAQCPQHLSVPECLSNTSLSSLPFSYSQLHVVSDTLLTIYVKNNISSAEINVAVQVVFPIRNLTVENVNNADIVEVGVNSMFMASSLGTVDSYTFYINGSLVPSVNGNCNYTFLQTGLSNLTVNASNHLGYTTVQLSIRALIRASVRNFMFTTCPGLAAVNKSVSFIFTSLTNVGAEINVKWVFGDGSSEEHSVFITNSVFHGNITHVFQSVGKFEVTVSLSDEFESVHNTCSINILNRLPVINIIPSKIVAKSYESISFNTEFESRLGLNLGSVLYTWNFADGTTNVTTSNNQVQHSFSVGDFTITVNATNNISYVSSEIVISIEEPIRNVYLTSDSPTKLSKITNFVIHKNSTIATNCTVKFGNNESFVTALTDFTYKYPVTGIYNVSIFCSNRVSNASAHLSVYVADTGTLYISDFNVPNFMVLGEQSNFSVTVVTLNPSPLKYIWNFEGGNFSSNLNTTTFAYNSPGSYNISIIITYKSVQVTKSKLVIVQEKITGLQVISPNILAVDRGHSITQTFYANCSTGSSVIYMWYVNSVVHTNNSQTADITFWKPKIYNVSIIALNDVSSSAENVLVKVVEQISNLTIHCSKCVSKLNKLYLASNTKTKFSAQYSSGTDIDFQWQFTDETINTTSVSIRKSLTYGIHQIKLTTSNKFGTHVAQEEITVLDPVKDLRMTTNSSTVMVGQTVQFLAHILSGSNVTYLWKMCPSCITNDTEVPVYEYKFWKSGEYMCELVAQNIVGKKSIMHRVYVVQPIEITNVSSYSYVAVNEFTNFTVTVNNELLVTYKWIVNGGTFTESTGTAKTFVHKFTYVGNFTILITVNNSLSTKTVTKYVQAIEKISFINIIGNSSSAEKGAALWFNGTCLGTNTTYVWKTGVNETNLRKTNASSSNFVHSFLDDGMYIIELTCSNFLSSKTTNTLVYIQERIESISIVASHSFYAGIGEIVTFSAHNVTGSDLNFLWVILAGDHAVNTSHGKVISYVFSDPHLFNITLTVSNKINSMSEYLLLNVQEPVRNLRLTASRWLIATGGIVSFSAVTSGSSIYYIWKIWDDTNGHTELDNKNARLEHTFNNPGIYRINVTVGNNISSASQSVVVTVQDHITGLSIDNCNLIYGSGQNVLFVGKATSGTNISFRWTVKLDSQLVKSGTSQNISVLFSKSGRYSVELTAENQISGQLSQQCHVFVENVISNITLAVEPSIDHIYVKQYVKFSIIGLNVNDAIVQWHFSDRTSVNTTNKYTSRKFTSTGNFSLEVTVFNNVSSVTNTIDFTVRILLCNFPGINYSGPSVQQLYRSRPVLFEVNVDTRNCVHYISMHKWEVFKAECDKYDLTNQVTLPSYIYTKTPTLFINAGILEYGKYCVKFTTGYKNTPVSTQAYFSLLILSSPLRAVIAGGTHLMVRNDIPVEMDGSESYDPDNLTSSNEHLSFHWTCHETVKSSGKDSCFPDNNKRKFNISHRNLEQGSVYNVTLTVADGSRSTSTFQTLQVVSEKIPVVSIKCVSCQATGVYVISSNQHIALESKCSNCSNVQYSWQVRREDNIQLVLTDDQTTTGVDGPNLVIRSGTIDDGFAYSFLVNVTQINIKKSTLAILTLKANHKPENGTCNVSPATITSLEERVYVSCKDWKDPDDGGSTLLYSVSVQRRNPVTNAEEKYNLYYGNQPKTSVYVSPWWDSSLPVDITVSVEDQEGAVVNQNYSVHVVKAAVSPSLSIAVYLYEKTAERLHFFSTQNNPVLLLQYSIALTMLLNSKSRQNSSVGAELAVQSKVRDAITTAVAGLPTTNLQDVQRKIFLWKLLSEYVTEYQKKKSLYLLMKDVKNTISHLQSAALQGLDLENFVPQCIIAVISNLIEATNLHHYHPSVYYHSISATTDKVDLDLQTDISTITVNELEFTEDEMRKYLIINALNSAEDMLSSVLKTQVDGEKPLEIKVPAMQTFGERISTNKLWSYRQLSECVILIPDGAKQSLPDFVFALMIVNNANPFTWGYSEKMPVTSQVASLSFTDTSAQAVEILNLTVSNNVKLIMRTADGKTVMNNFTGSIVTQPFYNPTEGLIYSSYTMSKNSSKKVTLDVSSAQLGSCLSIQFRINVLPNSSEKISGSVPTGSIDVYLAVNSNPAESSYQDSKTISSEMMLNGTDHRKYTFFISKDDFKPTNSYSLALYNRDDFHSVNVSVAIYMTTCQFFNLDTSLWDSTGCQPLDESIATYSVCSCNHLTSFGGSVLVPLGSIDFSDLGSLDLAMNPVAIITCSIIAIIYFSCLIICRYLDKLDYKRISYIPFCGKDGPYKYEVTIVTGKNIGAGTSANIGIKVYGKDGKCGAKHLYKQGAFNRNCKDMFLIANDTSLGELNKISIWHDNTGLSPSWFLLHVVIKDLQTMKPFYFFVHSWLSLEIKNGQIKKDVEVATEEQRNEHNHAFSKTFSRCVGDKHLWMSVLDCPAESRFTRVQRLTCCVTLVYTYMCVNIMWYGVLKQRTLNGSIVGSTSVSWEELILGLVTNTIVFPLNIGLVLLFKYSRSRSKPFSFETKPPSAQSIEVDYDYPTSGRMWTPYSDVPTMSERESTMDSSLPLATGGLRRTRTLLRRNSSRSNSLSGLKRNHALWSRDSILNNWPQRSRAAWEKRASIVSSTSSKQRTLSVDSTDDILEYIEKVDREIKIKDQKDKEEKASSLKRKSNKKEVPTQEGAKNNRKNSQTPSSKSLKSSWSSLDDILYSDDEEWWMPIKRKKQERIDRKKQKDKLVSEESKKQNSDGACATKQVPQSESSANINQKSSLKQPAAKSSFNPRDDAKLNNGRTNIPRKLCFASSNTSTQRKDSTNTIIRKDSWMSEEIELLERSITLGARNSTSLTNIPRKLSFASASTSTQRKDSTNTIIRKDSWMSEEIELLERSITLGARNSTSLSSSWKYPSPVMKKDGCTLPWWCCVITYILCFLLCCISIILVLLYGNEFGRDIALKWLLALFLSFLQSALLIEPLKVLGIAVYLKLLLKKVAPDGQNQEEDMDITPTVDLDVKAFKDVNIRPLGGFALLNAREEGLKLYRMKSMLKQCLMFFIFFWIIHVVAYLHYPVDSYLPTKVVENKFIHFNSTSFDLPFEKLKSAADFWSWSENIFAPQIHESNNMNELYLLGVPRLRQIRSTNTSCLAEDLVPYVSIPSLVTGGCRGKKEFDEDKNSYGEKWSTIVSNHTWQYSSETQLNGIPLYGQTSSYDGGGYVQNLGQSLLETLSSLQYLKANNWIDLRTRAVFVEFTLYSAVSELTTSVSLMTEFPLSGGILSMYTVYCEHLTRHESGLVNAMFVFQAFLCLCVLYLIIKTIGSAFEERRQYFKEFWNWVDICIILVALSCIGLYVACVIEATHSFQQYSKNPSSFINFAKSTYMHYIWRILNGLLIFILFIKITWQLRFIKGLHIFVITLENAAWKLFACSFMFLLLMVCYAHVGYLWYGHVINEFASFGKSLTSLFGIVRGSFNFWPILQQYRVFSHFYFYSFYAFVYGLIVGLILAVLLDSFKSTKAQNRFKATLDPHDYEMIEFMLKRFKMWAGMTKSKPAFRRVKFQGLPSLPSRSTYSSYSSHTISSSDSSGSSQIDSLISRLGSTWDSLLYKFEQVKALDCIEDELERMILREVKEKKWDNQVKKENKRVTGKPPIGPQKRKQGSLPNVFTVTKSAKNSATTESSSASGCSDRSPTKSASSTGSRASEKGSVSSSILVKAQVHSRKHVQLDRFGKVLQTKEAWK